MELLVLVGLGALGFWGIRKLVRRDRGEPQDEQSPRPPSSSPPPPSGGADPFRSGPIAPPRDPNVYRPAKDRAGGARPTIFFHQDGSGTTKGAEQNVEDLVDALTGRPLQRGVQLYQCSNCHVFYESNSYELIRSESRGRCVSCLSTIISPVGVTTEQRGRNAFVSVATLKNYREVVGRVITFEGVVYNVRSSQRGGDFALMFEDKSWTAGFKMVVFRRYVELVGGDQFLYGLVGRTVRVRGLLVSDPTFGYEMIVSDPGMILAVR